MITKFVSLLENYDPKPLSEIAADKSIHLNHFFDTNVTSTPKIVRHSVNGSSSELDNTVDIGKTS